MVHAVQSASSPPEPTRGPRPLDPPANDSGAYRSDWGGARLTPTVTSSPTPAPAPTLTARPTPTPSAPVEAVRDPARDAELANAQTNALLAEDVYRSRADSTPPPGWRIAESADLLRLGLTQSALEQPGSSFRARVYVTGEGADSRYVVAFRGSTPVAEDWLNNLSQGLGGPSSSYNKALFIGQRIANSDANVTMTGHSLGGGLASAAALASGREADTFNAAGLHLSTITRATAIRVASGQGWSAPHVDAYYVRGEILSLVQGAAPTAGLPDAPSAYGERHALDAILPDGKPWMKNFDPMDKHGHDWIQNGLAAARNR